MSRTTISVDSEVRDRLRTFGTKGMDYDDILMRLMDEVEREAFIAEARRLVKEDGYVPLEDV